MSAPIIVNLDLARDVARAACESAGITLVTPDDHPVVRRVVQLSVAAASPLTYAEVQQRVSTYVPEVVEGILALGVDLIGLGSPVASKAIGEALPRFDRPLILVSPSAWDDGATLLGVIGHEIGHHNDQRHAARSLGALGSVLHGAAYLGHPVLRVHFERCYSADMTAAVILRGVAPKDAAAGVMRSIEGYSPNAEARKLMEMTVGSVAASLEAGELPGERSPIHDVLRSYALAGGDLGPWTARVTA